jgi:hypothetical protein
MSFLDATDREKLLSECFDKNKVVLTCAKHKYSYGQKRPPVYNCKDCNMVSFVGLMCNIPPNRREEVMEMLEYSVHKLIEADKRGQIDRIKLFKHPQVTITRGD